MNILCFIASYKIIPAATDTLKESELKLESIRDYLSVTIENREKKGKSTDYVKIHETEKNNYSLICTSRRCKLLEDALPLVSTIIKLSFSIEDSQKKSFDFKVSKSQFSFEKQSSSNNVIIDDQITGLCKNISSIKTSLKDHILFVFNKFVTSFEIYQQKMESIINFITY